MEVSDARSHAQIASELIYRELTTLHALMDYNQAG